MDSFQPSTLETTALYVLRELNSLSPEDSYKAMIDLLSLIDRHWINALCVSYAREQNWQTYLQHSSTVKTPIPPIRKKGVISPHMQKWIHHT